MSTLLKRACITLLLSYCFLQCRKNNIALEDQLPPATQTGANTFGCKINDRVYISKGYTGTGKPNPHVIFDLGVNGLPYLQIQTQQLNENHEPEGYLIISFGNIIGTGIYNYPNFNLSTGWAKVLGNCFTSAFDSSIIYSGYGVITRYDLTNRIISGTFNFKFKTLTCDTVFITDGRFDYKF